MCGILGTYYFDRRRQVDERLLRAMADEVRHRGPDDEGYYVKRNLGLGFRRLAIIDLTPAGNQPMPNEDRTVWIVFNGEFYDFQRHRHALQANGHVFRSRTDTETILHFYESRGMRCLESIDGMFAFALWDEKKQELVLVRDRLGIKPLFYYIDSERIIFASEIKSILRDPSVPRELNPEALHHYLTFMTVPGPHTIFRNIFKLLPGHYLRLANGTQELVRYWTLPVHTDRSDSEHAWLSMLEERFAGAVQSQLVSDVPLGAFLSGGVDSSAVVAMMSRPSHPAVKTYSISFPGLDRYDESPYARQVSTLLHTEHKEFEVTATLADILPKLVWHFDEPFAVSSAFATYFLAKMAREHVTVALTGDGGDELFAGYPFRYSMDDRFRRISWAPQTIRRAIARTVQALPVFGPHTLREFLVKLHSYVAFFTGDADDAFFRTLTFFDEEEKSGLYTDAFRSTLQSPPSIEVLRQHYREFSSGDRVNRRLFADIKTTLVDEMLTKVDRMTMASSLEARVPILDHRLVELASAIPGRLKIQGQDGKQIFKQMLRPYLPADILSRRKHGFNVPMDRWLRRELFEFMSDLLSEDTLRRRGYFNPDRVRKLITDHVKGRANNVGQLYILMTFELWHRIFMDGTSVPAQ